MHPGNLGEFGWNLIFRLENFPIPQVFFGPLFLYTVHSIKTAYCIVVKFWSKIQIFNFDEHRFLVIWVFVKAVRAGETFLAQHNIEIIIVFLSSITLRSRSTFVKVSCLLMLWCTNLINRFVHMLIPYKHSGLDYRYSWFFKILPSMYPDT